MNEYKEAYKAWNKRLFNDLVKPRLVRATRRNKRADKLQAKAYARIEADNQARLERHQQFINAQAKDQPRRDNSSE